METNASANVSTFPSGSGKSTPGLCYAAALINTNDPTQIDNINPELFKGLTEEAIYQALSTHVTKYGVLPSRETLAGQIGCVIPEHVPEPAKFYFDQMVDRHVHHQVKQGLMVAKNLINEQKPHQALGFLQDLIEEIGAANGTAEGHPITWASELMKPYTAPAYLVHGILEQGASVGLVAPFGAGKTFLALEVAACVATGTPFHGRKVTQGLVVYLCGEGQNGIRYRLQALKYGRGIDTGKAPLAIFPEAVSLLSDAGFERVKQVIRGAEQETGSKLALLIVDTMSRYFGGGEENSASDMNVFLDRVANLRGTGTSLVIHHTGHADKSRGRGASVWDQALDTSIVVSKDAQDGKLIEVTNSKQKDGEVFQPLRFRIVGGVKTDSAYEDGSPKNSAVLEPTDEIPAKPITGKQQIKLFVHLEEQVGAETLDVWTHSDLVAIAKKLGIPHSSSHAAVNGLISAGQLVPDGSGYRLKDHPKSKNHPNVQIGSMDQVVQNVQNPPGVGLWTGLENGFSPIELENSGLGKGFPVTLENLDLEKLL